MFLCTFLWFPFLLHLYSHERQYYNSYANIHHVFYFKNLNKNFKTMCLKPRLDCHVVMQRGFTRAFSGTCWEILPQIKILIFVTLKICHIFEVLKWAEGYGFRSERRAKCLMSWTLDGLSISVFVEIIVDVVHLRRRSAVHIVKPVADSVQLIKQRSIGTEEAALLTRRETPMPDLRNRTVSFDYSFIDDSALLIMWHSQSIRQLQPKRKWN
jgi:hypothetical protein